MTEFKLHPRVVEVAAQLDGCEYHNEGSKELWVLLKAQGIVVVYGYSDDLMEFSGAIDDEIGAETAYVTPAGLFEACECECTYSKKALKATRTIKALWCAEPDICWTYETDIPHATFNVMEDGEVYCRGIVFALADVRDTSESDTLLTRLRAAAEAVRNGEWGIDLTNLSREERAKLLFGEDDDK